MYPKLVRGLCVLILVAAGCQSDGTTATSATAPAETAAAAAVTTSVPTTVIQPDTASTEPTVETTSDLDAEMQLVSEIIDTFWVETIDVYQIEANALQAGDRASDATGKTFGPTAELATRALDALPQELSDPSMADVYSAYLESFELLIEANEAGAERYEADPEIWSADWDEQTALAAEIFEPKWDAEANQLDRCFALGEAFIAAGGPDLNCVGTGVAPPENDRYVYEEVAVGDVVEIDTPVGAFTYVTPEEGFVSTGEGWAEGGPVVLPGLFWLGVPDSLADPTVDLGFDRVEGNFPFQLDLDEWASSFDELDLFGSGEGDVAGYPARYWDLRVNLEVESDFPVYAVVGAEWGAPFPAMQLGPPDAIRIYTFETPDGPAAFILMASLGDDPAWEEAFATGDFGGADQSGLTAELDQFEIHRLALSTS